MQEQTTGLNLTKAKPMRLSSQATDQIRNLISKGILKPGDKLPSEQILSQQLGVSRPSLREALRGLESEGLIEVRVGNGAYVAESALMMSSLNAAIKRLIQREALVLQLLQVRHPQTDFHTKKFLFPLSHRRISGIRTRPRCKCPPPGRPRGTRTFRRAISSGTRPGCCPREADISRYPPPRSRRRAAKSGLRNCVAETRPGYSRSHSASIFFTCTRCRFSCEPHSLQGMIGNCRARA